MADEEVKESSKEALEAAKAKMQAAVEKSKSETGESSEASEASSGAGKDDKKKKAVSAGMEKTDDKPVNESLMDDIHADESKALESVKIYSPFRVYYDGEAESISAVNLTGPFDILPGHKNFMTLLTSGEIIVRSKRGAEKLKIDRGVMHVRRNRVEIFLDI